MTHEDKSLDVCNIYKVILLGREDQNFTDGDYNAIRLSWVAFVITLWIEKKIYEYKVGVMQCLTVTDKREFYIMYIYITYNIAKI
jgi:hypothetical protein